MCIKVIIPARIIIRTNPIPSQHPSCMKLHNLVSKAVTEKSGSLNSGYNFFHQLVF